MSRLGIRSLVLEQSETLRTEGTSITLFKNGWKVLDAIGVGSNLRSQFLEIEGYGHAILISYFLALHLLYENNCKKSISI